jgi:hypothetical protein
VISGKKLSDPMFLCDGRDSLARKLTSNALEGHSSEKGSDFILSAASTRVLQPTRPSLQRVLGGVFPGGKYQRVNQTT